MENVLLGSSNQLLTSFILFFAYLISLTLNLKALTEFLFIALVLINSFFFVYIIFFANQSSKKSYLLKKCSKEYIENTENLTKLELEKLFKNPKFIDLYKERGPDTAKWCWQTKDNQQDYSDMSQSVGLE